MNLIGSLFPFGYLAMVFLIVAGFLSQDWKGFLLAVAVGMTLATIQLKLLNFGIGIDLATTGHSAAQDARSGTIFIFIVTTGVCVIAGIKRLSTRKPRPKDHENGSK